MDEKTTRNIVIGIFFLGLSLDLFYFPAASDFRYALLIFLWWVAIYMFKLKSRVTFLLAAALICMLFIFYLFAKDSPIMERMATWVYLLGVFGIIQQFFEIRKEK
jgi:hypothetical protein